MEFSLVTGDITQHDSPAIVVGIMQGVTELTGAVGKVDLALDGAIASLIEDGEIKGKRGEITLLHTLGKLQAKRVVVAGLGDADSVSINTVRALAGSVGRFLRSKGVTNYASAIHGAGAEGLGITECAQALVEGAELGMYRFDKHKSEQNSPQVESITLAVDDDSQTEEVETGVNRGRIIADAVNLCRSMANEPPNFMTPTAMAEDALGVATSTGIELEVLDRPQMTELGMGALLGVAQGSSEPPKLITLRYNGDPDNEENNLAIVGKGITFDSGGLDLKSAAGMLEMKSDMAGGASIIGAMKAIAQLKPTINVVGIVPATENMPGGKAQRPSDVVTAMNGKTIEIGNTDAEGRLVLADGVAYARSLGITKIVDVATLTGAVVVALGNLASGIFGNDQTWIDTVIQAGEDVGERLWQLPTFDEYKDQYKSDIADINNTGGRGAGATIGALIIGEFADGAQWAHLDIAGTNRTSKVDGFNPKGATGAPVRTLVALAESLSAE
ncbi:MAG: leucyl aminopeptidase [SAR202 cluster bacterium]|jgi:leucyl aminopeptidase|nr:leucyl aminopeptidase [SAR202 cluster bacterium]MDP6512262.1 leucyl aminopeptidase [SAR202 cluster bacterium]MDP6716023.1 leucyl aminopeptidase [SAR202 cluster bacterium]